MAKQNQPESLTERAARLVDVFDKRKALPVVHGLGRIGMAVVKTKMSVEGAIANQMFRLDAYKKLGVSALVPAVAGDYGMYLRLPGGEVVHTVDLARQVLDGQIQALEQTPAPQSAPTPSHIPQTS